MGKADDLRAAREAAFKSSRGGVESGHTGSTAVFEAPEAPRPPNSKRTGTARTQPTEAGVAPGPREATKPKGRPLDKDRAKSFEATKPWLAEGMSRRTWYRRRAKEGGA